MKRFLSLLLVLGLCLSLVGCSSLFRRGSSDEEKVFSRKGFSITLPADSVDFSYTQEATEDPFVFLAGDIVIAAKILNRGDTQGISLEDYTLKIMERNGYGSDLKQKDGLWTFTFTEDGGMFLNIILKTDTSFWLVNASCDVEDYSDLKDTMWQYLTSVQVSDY